MFPNDIILSDEKLFGETKISNFKLRVMNKDIVSFYVSMNNVVRVKFLNIIKLTAIPFRICLIIKIASFYGILWYFYMYSSRVPLLQYSITMIFRSIFKQTSRHLTRLGELHLIIILSSVLLNRSLISLTRERFQ